MEAPMNQMNQHAMQQHVPILGWIYVVGHAIFLAAGFVVLLLIGLAPAAGEPASIWTLGVVGTAVGLLMVALALPGLLAGYGLLTRKPWGRMLAMAVGILGLVNFPLGTAIGVYTLWVLTQPAASEYFAAPAPA
jgi:hypothetical protein